MNSLHLWKTSIPLGLLLFSLSSLAASPCDEKGGSGSEPLRACKRFSCQAQSACEGAKQSASSRNSKDAKSVANKYANRNEIANSAYDMAGVGSRSASNLGQAANYCRALGGSSAGGASSQGTCESMCDPSKIPQGAKDAEKERQEMDSERQSCLAAVNGNASGMDQGKQANEDAAKDAQKTGDQAQGGGQGKGGEEKGGEKGGGEEQKPQAGQDPKPTEQSKTDPTQPKCDGPEAASQPACTSKLESECVGVRLMNDARCKSFAERYCSTGFSGSGASSDFCKQRLAQNFCKSSGRSNCPSCNGRASSITSASGSQLVELCNACASGSDIDPVFSDPEVARVCRSASAGEGSGGGFTPASSSGNGSPTLGGSAATAGSPGGGGGGAMGSDGNSAQLGADSRRDEDARDRLKTDIGGAEAGGGGGGGSSYSGGGSFNESGRDEGGGSSGGSGRSLASQDVNPAPDVMKSRGPSIFLIQSEVIRNRCANGKLMHCEKGQR